jgi:hypothetical protein
MSPAKLSSYFRGGASPRHLAKTILRTVAVRRRIEAALRFRKAAACEGAYVGDAAAYAAAQITKAQLR